MWWLVTIGTVAGGALGYFGGREFLSEFGWHDAEESPWFAPAAGLLLAALAAASALVVGGARISAGEWEARPLGRKVCTAALVLLSPGIAVAFTLSFFLAVIFLIPDATGPVFDVVAVAQMLFTPLLAMAASAAGGLWGGGGLGRRVAAALFSGVFAFVAYACGLGVTGWFINTYVADYLP